MSFVRKNLLRGCLVAALAAPTTALAAAYGVVIGIDDYANFSDLEGAVNDAEDIASALRGRDAHVIVLRDHEATRSAVVGALRSQLAKAVAGDVVIFSFAGHGVQLEEALVGDEIDGRDESFALHGFAATGPGAGERLRDNDIAMILLEAPPGVSILFVADSCHSGTMTRAPVAGVELGKTRFLELGPIFEDPLAPPDDRSFQVGPNELGHVVFAAAARDHELTPEILIDGQRRGALSYSIARAIEGAADGGDGETSLEDLRSFIRAEVRSWSGARQTPDVDLGGEAAASIAAFLSPALANDADRYGHSDVSENGTLSAAQNTNLANAGAQLAASTPDAYLSSRSAPKFFMHGDPQLVDQARRVLGDAVLMVDIEAEATLFWDAVNGRLIDRISADMLAEVSTAEAVASAIRKWRAVGGLARWAPARSLKISLIEGDGLHRLGDHVSFRIDPPDVGPTAGRLTLFNLASGGEVQYIYPSTKTAEKGDDIMIRGRNARQLGPSKVSEPTGADHIVAVLTPVDATSTDLLRAGLLKLNGTQDPAGALALLAAHASDPRNARVGVLPLFTERP